MNSIMQSTCRRWVFIHPDRSLANSATEFGLVPSISENGLERTWDDVIAELVNIRDLKSDWDGQGSEAPASALIDGAVTLAQELKDASWSPADRVAASVNATVYFEWHTPLGYHEIEVTSSHDAESRWVGKGSDAATVVQLICR